MTLNQTAKLNGVDPQAWLTDLLERIVARKVKANDLHRLLPWNWKAAIAATAASQAA
jgi:transposase